MTPLRIGITYKTWFSASSERLPELGTLRDLELYLQLQLRRTLRELQLYHFGLPGELSLELRITTLWTESLAQSSFMDTLCA